jgi:hypothetical protein
MLKSCSIRHGIPASCRTRPSSSLASTWTTAQHKLRRQCMGKESNRPHLAQKALDFDAGLARNIPHTVTRSVRRGSGSPKLLGVLV